MEQKELTGILSHNDRKMSDKSPSYRGTALIEGKEYYVSLWKKTSLKNGKVYLTLSFKPKEEPPTKVAQLAVAVGGNTEILNEEPLTDDVPF